MLVSEYHQQLSHKLSQLGTDTAELESRLLISHFLKLDYTQFILQQDRIITTAEMTQLQAAQTKALADMPLSRILQNREFWGLEFTINQHVLDPRADSEILIETILHFLPPTTTNQQQLKFLDLGTGSGCLLLSLLHEYKNATGIGADISADALKVAQQNAQNLKLNSRAKFIKSNWFNNIKPQKFDIILANPPYIPSADIDNLDNNVKLYDPLSALDGGADGLDPYHLIAQQAAEFLTPNGLLIFEMGYNQADQLFAILEKYGFSSAAFDMTSLSANQHQQINGLGLDLGGNPRIIISQLLNGSNL